MVVASVVHITSTVKKSTRWLATLVAVALLHGACTAGDEDDGTLEIGQTSEELTVPNGVYLNGVYLNGVYLNGVYLNGVYLNGVYLNGVYLNGVYLNGVYLNGVYLNGTALSTTSLSAQDFVGAQLNATLSDGTPVVLRIDAVEQSAADAEIFFHTLSLASSTAGPWSPLCGADATGSIKAIALGGRWDYATGAKVQNQYQSVITIACRGGAIAKCVEMAYKPWKTLSVCNSLGLNCQQVNLEKHHQSCTRLIRADYCGNGTSFTVNGTPVNIYDAVGVQQDTENWPVEAEWGIDGARCLSNQNRYGGQIPSCAEADITATACGAGAFARGALLISEFGGGL
jgi:hypothetical protein